uniref:Reverse transcriptase domain-containing protein n=1 Tax=Aegilops tauschii subsp. strangulata TaxID=200361 RepID=A0A453HKB5_AEGTS
GAQILHRRGLRQGDPLSPLLFIIAIDPIHRLLQAAEEALEIMPVPGREVKLRVSLYADDAIIFANPGREEIDHLMHILQSFGDASGLRINLAKSTATPIHCNDIDL